MGEDKRKRSGPEALARRVAALKAAFAEIGVDDGRVGFYDDPAFVAAEKRDPRALESYAEWVLIRPRDAEYDRHVRKVVPRLATIIEGRIDREQWLGSCIVTATAMARMLDRLGVWNCVFKGSLTVDVLSRPQIGSRHLWYIDELDFPGGFAGHAWLTAPPFMIVDATVRHQRWREQLVRDAIPRIVLAEHPKRVPARPEDLVSDDARMQYYLQTHRADAQYYFVRDFARFERIFPAQLVRANGVELRYVPVGVTASDLPLEEMGRDADGGVRAVDIWRTDVAPAFLPDDEGAGDAKA